ncbi:MAG: helix-turn-helix transcriptional regulator [Bacteroidetes bacterium]|nr:helix-turn-helix transcriptional regulator [Bacteroidota bacterium]
MIDKFALMIEADIKILYQSDFFRIINYKCYCTICSLSEPEYNNSFCISFIRKGFFEYGVFRNQYEMYVGRMLLSKPGYEHRTRHINNHPDITTVFEFRPSFFELLKEQFHSVAGWFLSNNDLHALMHACTLDADYLHLRIVEKIQSGSFNTMQVDEMVIELLNKIFYALGNESDLLLLNDKFKQLHLGTIEKAVEYLREHFHEDISLTQLSQYCFASPFHFSRIFKAVMGIPPHKYLLGLRLQHAKFLLLNSIKSVTDIAFESGFQSLEHFTTGYKQHFKINPTQQRKENSKV